MPTILEFWPEYSQGPLWSTDGTAIDPTVLRRCSGEVTGTQILNSRPRQRAEFKLTHYPPVAE